ncbi:MAG: UDP-N-acetylglucosamine 1-carboxyvinyltransferase, partial [Acidimicrobiia bacterium]
MAEIIVTGGNALAGNVSVLGAKNAVLKQQVAALLAPGKHMLENVPHIADVELMSEVLSFVGATCELEDHT